MAQFIAAIADNKVAQLVTQLCKRALESESGYRASWLHGLAGGVPLEVQPHSQSPGSSVWQDVSSADQPTQR